MFCERTFSKFGRSAADVVSVHVQYINEHNPSGAPFRVCNVFIICTVKFTGPILTRGAVTPVLMCRTVLARAHRQLFCDTPILGYILYGGDVNFVFYHVEYVMKG